jgi:hypothetical protein
MIAPLPKPVRDYLAGFNLGCVVVSATGEIQAVGSDHLARITDIEAALSLTPQRVRQG